jgi:signal transduction histidine kinase
MLTPLRLLVVEDAEDDVLLLIRQLRQGGYDPSYERVETADGLRSALHRGGWEVIISDYTMPRFSGLEALAITLQLAPDVPFLLISGTVGEEVAVESIKAGAADYLMKQNLIRFVPAVTRAIRDAAERRAMRRAEAVLREQRSLLGMIYDNTSDALILHTWDPARARWLITSANRATLTMARALGSDLSEMDLIGKPFEDAVRAYLNRWGDVAASLTEDLHRATETGRPAGREITGGVGTGAVHLDVTYIPFHGPDSGSRHVLFVARDVTARKKAEADRRAFENRLAQARKMEALGQLAGGVAHDFNNILAGILGFAEVIQKSTPDPAAAGFSAEIVQASKRARDLVRQILMFSRRQPGERKPVLLSGIVREALRIIHGSAPAAVQVVARYAADELFVLGDATQLHQAALNLATNAVQALGEAGGRVNVAVEVVNVSADFARGHPPLREGEHVRLSVADDGPGIPASAMEHLFEPFFTTKAQGVGTGLGLAVVHGVVQTHEGAVVVRSQEGVGTCFELYFPAVHSPSWAGEIVMPAEVKRGIGHRVLVVDDEPAITKLAKIMLKSLGHTATAFGHPDQALEVLRAGPAEFDLIITDLTMPGTTGVEFAREVRELGADMPIILSSGYADEVSEETLRELGIVEVLPKPFQMASLGEAVTRATGR